MNDYSKIVGESYQNFWNYLWGEITFSNGTPIWKNYVYMLLFVSLFFLILEWVKPWRENQAKFRKDFWLDFFYMYFNFFLFGLIIFFALSNVVVAAINDMFAYFGITNLVALNIQQLPIWAYVLVAFLIDDFIKWSTHRVLHRVEWLWKFHQVHHSVEQMGFAAHLRYHWMENVVYKAFGYFPLALLGIDLGTYWGLHIFTLVVGHFNHSNIRVPLGPLKYIFNNPQMHIWHHAKYLPSERRYGANFGITLSVWDYIFGTNYIPHDGKNISIGIEGQENFSSNFLRHTVHGFWSDASKDHTSETDDNMLDTPAFLDDDAKIAINKSTID